VGGAFVYPKPDIRKAARAPRRPRKQQLKIFSTNKKRPKQKLYSPAPKQKTRGWNLPTARFVLQEMLFAILFQNLHTRYP